MDVWIAINKKVLSELNLVISAQQTTAIVGSSGAGKSTLADLLMGLLMPDVGEILVDGQPLHAKRARLWRQTVAYVPQDTFLFHDTVRAAVGATGSQRCGTMANIATCCCGSICGRAARWA